jgi:hypothetical protein
MPVTFPFVAEVSVLSLLVYRLLSSTSFPSSHSFISLLTWTLFIIVDASFPSRAVSVLSLRPEPTQGLSIAAFTLLFVPYVPALSLFSARLALYSVALCVSALTWLYIAISLPRYILFHPILSPVISAVFLGLLSQYSSASFMELTLFLIAFSITFHIFIRFLKKSFTFGEAFVASSAISGSFLKTISDVWLKVGLVDVKSFDHVYLWPNILDSLTMLRLCFFLD